MFQARIEKLVYGGAGLARVNGQVVLVPLVLPGETVLAEPVKEQPGLLHARLAQVVEPSPERTQPLCPYFTRCGGCHYQHAGYEQQLRFKKEILLETLSRVGKLAAPEPEVIAAEPWHYRNRTQLKFEKHGDGFRLGYFEMGSNRLLEVEHCPISSPRINELIPELWALGRRPDFAESSGQIELFASHDDAGVLLNVAASAPWPETLLSAARERLPGLASMAVAGAPDRPPRIFGKGHLVYRAAGFEYRVSHGSFFQVNRFLTDRFLEAAIEGLGGETVVELFAGAGYFTIPLAHRFQRVIAVEAGRSGIRDLESNRSRAGANNVDVRQGAVDEFLARWNPQREPSVSAVLLDPPRAGLGRKAAERLAALGAPAIVYVSCDPATLARDLAALTAHGYRLVRLRLVDLFPQTFHIESVARLEK